MDVLCFVNLTSTRYELLAAFRMPTSHDQTECPLTVRLDSLPVTLVDSTNLASMIAAPSRVL